MFLEQQIHIRMIFDGTEDCIMAAIYHMQHNDDLLLERLNTIWTARHLHHLNTHTPTHTVTLMCMEVITGFHCLPAQRDRASCLYIVGGDWTVIVNSVAPWQRRRGICDLLYNHHSRRSRRAWKQTPPLSQTKLKDTFNRLSHILFYVLLMISSSSV